MRIISKYRDYYDSVMAHGQDLSTVYLRKPEWVNNPLLDDILRNQRSLALLHGYTISLPKELLGIKSISVTSAVLMVVGKIYRAVRVKKDFRTLYDKRGFETEESVARRQKSEDYFYSFAELVEFLNSVGTTPEKIVRGMFGRETKNAQGLRDWVNYQGHSYWQDEFIAAREIILGYAYNEQANAWMLQRNGSLSDVKFYKLMDPFTIYQELDMYISGVLGQQAKEIITISDKDRIPQHGFDEYSFRKLPEEGKKSKKHRL
jgi:hypothetical protein